MRLAGGLTLAILLDTAVQLVWKRAVSGIPEGTSALAAIGAAVHQPLFLALVVLLALQLTNWVKVLDGADLSFAQPITSLSYVTVCLLSALYLGEEIGLMQSVGIGFVLAGVWFISRSDPVSHIDDTAAHGGIQP